MSDDIMRIIRQATFGNPQDVELLSRVARLAAAHEREACAAIVEDWSQGKFPDLSEKIRSRND